MFYIGHFEYRQNINRLYIPIRVFSFFTLCVLWALANLCDSMKNMTITVTIVLLSAGSISSMLG